MENKNPRAPCFLLVLDTTMDAAELQDAKDSLGQLVALLPEECLVGLITFGEARRTLPARHFVRQTVPVMSLIRRIVSVTSLASRSVLRRHYFSGVGLPPHWLHHVMYESLVV
jgi:hypothetical protein